MDRASRRWRAAATSGSSRSSIRTGDPFGFFEASATVGQGVDRRRLPARSSALPRWRLPPAIIEGSHADPGADAPDDAARDERPAVRAGRRLQPHPLEERPPATARSRSRSSTSSRPPTSGSSSTSSGAVQTGTGDESTVETAVRAARVDRRPGAAREPGRRADRGRHASRGPAGRPRRPPAPEDHAAARGRRRPTAPTPLRRAAGRGHCRVSGAA